MKGSEHIHSNPIVVNSLDMVLSIARALDLLHPSVSEHHLRVAYICACLAEEVGLSEAEVQSILVAGAMHDVAAACAPRTRPLLDRALKSRHFEGTESNVHEHGFEAYRMLSGFGPFTSAATIIQYHHVEWNYGTGEYFEGDPVPFESHILHLADRVAVLMPNGHSPQVYADGIRTAIQTRAGRHFHPKAVAGFEQIACKDSFWLDVTSQYKVGLLKERFGGKALILDEDNLHDLAKVFANIVDHRSPYTARHSSGVAKASELLAEKAGFSRSTVRLIGVAGYLHDLGKLSISPDLLEKRGKLTREEMLLIRQHPYYTRQILSAVPGLEEVTLWAALHHERLDGQGYPFREKRLPFEAQIVAVADIFTALTEDRPYRAGMKRDACMNVMYDLVNQGAISDEVVSLL